MPTKEVRRAHMLTLDYSDFQVAIFEEIDIVAAETKEKTKAEIDDICEGRFGDVIKIMDDWKVAHENWKIAHSASLDENTTISKKALDAILALEKKIMVTIAVEDGVKKGVGAIGRVGDLLGFLGQWALKAVGGVIVICAIVALFTGYLTQHDIIKFMFKELAK